MAAIVLAASSALARIDGLPAVPSPLFDGLPAIPTHQFDHELGLRQSRPPKFEPTLVTRRRRHHDDAGKGPASRSSFFLDISHMRSMLFVVDAANLRLVPEPLVDKLMGKPRVVGRAGETTCNP